MHDDRRKEEDPPHGEVHPSSPPSRASTTSTRDREEKSTAGRTVTNFSVAASCSSTRDTVPMSTFGG